jgi:hypothetical protein
MRRIITTLPAFNRGFLLQPEKESDRHIVSRAGRDPVADPPAKDQSKMRITCEESTPRAQAHPKLVQLTAGEEVVEQLTADPVGGAIPAGRIAASGSRDASRIWVATRISRIIQPALVQVIAVARIYRQTGQKISNLD